MKLFRNIRANLLSEGKTTKYLKYAIGEIILVVIGILIALQINNWNSQRIEAKKIQQYYMRIHQELQSTVGSSEQFHTMINALLQQNRRSLILLSIKHKDSLKKLEQTLGALATVYANGFSFPIVEEFLSQDYLAKIENDSIKLHLQNFSGKLNVSRYYDDYIFNQYRTVIEPFFNKNINYPEVALPSQRKNLIEGGPPTDYEVLSKNLELWNMLSFKVEVLEEQKRELNQFISLIERLDMEILKELK